MIVTDSTRAGIDGHYLFHGDVRPDGTFASKEERVKFTGRRRLYADPDDRTSVEREMRARAGESSRIEKPFFHAKLSLDTGERTDQEPERLSEEEWVAVMQQYARRMGLEGHQCWMVVHKDKPHEHAHLMFNRVPQTGGPAWNPWRSHTRGQDAAREIEVEQGLRRVQGTLGRYTGEELGPSDVGQRVVPERGSGIPGPARAEEKRTGKPSFNREAKGAREILQEASSWKELEEGLHAEGIGIERSGGGAVLKKIGGDDRHRAPLWKIGRACTLPKLQNRLGPLAHYRLRQAAAHKRRRKARAKKRWEAARERQSELKERARGRTPALKQKEQVRRERQRALDRWDPPEGDGLKSRRKPRRQKTLSPQEWARLWSRSEQVCEAGRRLRGQAVHHLAERVLRQAERFQGAEAQLASSREGAQETAPTELRKDSVVLRGRICREMHRRCKMYEEHYGAGAFERILREGTVPEQDIEEGDITTQGTSLNSGSPFSSGSHLREGRRGLTAEEREAARVASRLGATLAEREASLQDSELDTGLPPACLDGAALRVQRALQSLSEGNTPEDNTVENNPLEGSSSEKKTRQTLCALRETLDERYGRDSFRAALEHGRVPEERSAGEDGRIQGRELTNWERRVALSLSVGPLKQERATAKEQTIVKEQRAAKEQANGDRDRSTPTNRVDMTEAERAERTSSIQKGQGPSGPEVFRKAPESSGQRKSPSENLASENFAEGARQGRSALPALDTTLKSGAQANSVAKELWEGVQRCERKRAQGNEFEALEIAKDLRRNEVALNNHYGPDALQKAIERGHIPDPKAPSSSSRRLTAAEKRRAREVLRLGKRGMVKEYGRSRSRAKGRSSSPSLRRNEGRGGWGY